MLLIMIQNQIAHIYLFYSLGLLVSVVENFDNFFCHTLINFLFYTYILRYTCTFKYSRNKNTYDYDVYTSKLLSLIICQYRSVTNYITHYQIVLLLINEHKNRIISFNFISRFSLEALIFISRFSFKSYYCVLKNICIKGEVPGKVTVVYNVKQVSNTFLVYIVYMYNNSAEIIYKIVIVNDLVYGWVLCWYV